MKWPSRRLLGIEILGDLVSSTLLLGSAFLLIRGMGFGCPLLKSVACDR